MNTRNFLVIFLAIVIAVVYTYYISEKNPDKATAVTPKQYIELIEKGKADQQRDGRSD